MGIENILVIIGHNPKKGTFHKYIKYSVSNKVRVYHRSLCKWKTREKIFHFSFTHPLYTKTIHWTQKWICKFLNVFVRLVQFHLATHSTSVYRTNISYVEHYGLIQKLSSVSNTPMFERTSLVTGSTQYCLSTVSIKLNHIHSGAR